MDDTAKAIADVCWAIGRNFGGGREDDREVRRALRKLKEVRETKAKQ